MMQQARISIQSVTVIVFRLWCKVKKELKDMPIAFPDHLETQETACFSVYNRQDIDALFLLPMKENTSSNSAVSTSSGTGGIGRYSACCFTQFATDWWFTFKWRAFLRSFMTATNIWTACWRSSRGYTFGLRSGVYSRWQYMHWYLCEPAFVRPALFCRVVWRLCGHFIPRVYPTILVTPEDCLGLGKTGL